MDFDTYRDYRTYLLLSYTSRLSYRSILCLAGNPESPVGRCGEGECLVHGVFRETALSEEASGCKKGGGVPENRDSRVSDSVGSEKVLEVSDGFSWLYLGIYESRLNALVSEKRLNQFERDVPVPEFGCVQVPEYTGMESEILESDSASDSVTCRSYRFRKDRDESFRRAIFDVFFEKLHKPVVGDKCVSPDAALPFGFSVHPASTAKPPE